MPTRFLIRTSLTALAAAALWAVPAAADDPFLADQFDPLHRLLKPQPGEAKWAAVPWLTDLTEARRRAAAEDKPLFVWRSGGGAALGRC
jgi:hypothetical protein